MDQKPNGPYKHVERPSKSRSIDDEQQDNRGGGPSRWGAVIVILLVIIISSNCLAPSFDTFSKG